MSRRASKPRDPFPIGCKVRLTFGVDQMTAVVIEDRGNLGVGGRRLLRVRLDMADTSEPIELEIRAESLTPVAA